MQRCSVANPRLLLQPRDERGFSLGMILGLLGTPPARSLVHHRIRKSSLAPQRLTGSSFGANLIRSSACCVSSVMTSHVEFWRQEPAAKAEGIAQEIERIAGRAAATGLSVTAYILRLAVEEARKEATEKKIQSTVTRHGSRVIEDSRRLRLAWSDKSAAAAVVICISRNSIGQPVAG
jgi:hypothetical protein